MWDKQPEESEKGNDKKKIRQQTIQLCGSFRAMSLHWFVSLVQFQYSGSDIKEITPALIQQKEFILYGDVFFLRYVAHNGDMTDYIVIKKSYVN